MTDTSPVGRGHSTVVACPLPHGSVPGTARSLPGSVTRASRSGARRGRPAPRAALPEPNGGGGRRRARGRRGLLQCCNAALRREPSPAARERSAARHCCNAGVSAAPPPRPAGPNRAEPGWAAREPPSFQPPAPPRASALLGFLVPVSFSSRSCRDRGTFPPAAGCAPPNRPVFAEVGPHPAPRAGRPPPGPRTTLTVLTSPFYPSPPRLSLRLPPTPGPLRSPRCCTDPGQVPELGSDPLWLLLGGTSPPPHPAALPSGPPPRLPARG